MLSESSGRYEILRSLAAGGMAEVFLARVQGAAGFSKLVALKRIHRDLADDDTFVERFIDEARLAAQLNHPNIVQIFDLGIADGAYFIAMEYVHGKTVWDLCRESSKRKQIAPLDMALGIVVAACEGLGFAHDQRGEDGQPLGIVHRDVSPQNLLISFDGAVKVADFGIARAAGSVHKTEVGAIVGKLSYMSPEQMLGLGVDARTDLYALGVVMHEILTAQKLWTPQEIDPERRRNPYLPSSVNPMVPPDLDEIALKALAFDADKRYQTCDQLREDLERVMAKLGIVNSARRRAELTQQWFPNDRTPPNEASFRNNAQQRVERPTIALERTGISSTSNSTSRSGLGEGPTVPATPARLPGGGAPTRPMKAVEDTAITSPKERFEQTPTPAPTPTPTPIPMSTPSPPSPPSMPSMDLMTSISGVSRPLSLPPRPESDASRLLKIGAIGFSCALLVTAGVYSAMKPKSEPTVVKVDAPKLDAPKLAPPVVPVAKPPDDAPTEPERTVAPPDPTPPPPRHVADADLDPRGSKRHHDDVKAAPKHERGALTLTTTPTVSVFLGRSSLGKTPLKEAALPAGRNKLRLVARDSGIDYPLEVDVAAGETVTKSVTVGKGKLRIKAVPWAQVVVDGNNLGTTPLPAQPLYAGTHTVVLTYKPDNGPQKMKREQLIIKEGEDRLLEADLR